MKLQTWKKIGLMFTFNWWRNREVIKNLELNVDNWKQLSEYVSKYVSDWDLRVKTLFLFFIFYVTRMSNNKQIGDGAWSSF